MNDGSLEMPLDWIEGVENIRLKDMPTLIRTTDPKDIMLNFMSNEAQNCLKSSAIIFNTFAELEHPSLGCNFCQLLSYIFYRSSFLVRKTLASSSSCKIS